MHQIGYLVENPIIPHFSNTKLPRFTRLWLSAFFYAPHINSVNRGMPVIICYNLLSLLESLAQNVTLIGILNHI